MFFSVLKTETKICSKTYSLKPNLPIHRDPYNAKDISLLKVFYNTAKTEEGSGKGGEGGREVLDKA